MVPPHLAPKMVSIRQCIVGSRSQLKIILRELTTPFRSRGLLVPQHLRPCYRPRWEQSSDSRVDSRRFLSLWLRQ